MRADTNFDDERQLQRGRPLGHQLQGPVVGQHHAEDVSERMMLEEQLRSAQKMEAIGRLSGGLAHNFNNILTAIIGNCELLAPLALSDAKSTRYVENMQSAAQRAAALTRQLMAFCRKQPLNAQPIAIDGFARRLEDLVRGVLDPDTTLRVALGAGEATVLADDSQLEQAVLNLALNARDAIEAGGVVTLTTGLAELERLRDGAPDQIPPGSYAVLTIADDGPGLTPEILAHVFEPFFTTKEGGKSPGLGLATVYGIVKQTGGFVFCDSVMGQGTTFRIFLPRHIVTAEETAAAIAAAIPVKKVASDHTGAGTVLLVEDEDAVRALNARMLASRGYTVLEAASGVEALEVFDEAGGAVDLVVSDVVMPEMDGPTMLGHLRQRNPATRIIFVSGYAEEAFKKNLPEGEAFGFLAKPFTMKQLVEAVKVAMA